MKKENAVIRNRISNFDKRHISQPKIKYTNQPWITEDCWWQLYFILCIQWKKTVKKHHKLTKNSVGFSCQSKQVSRCCINFLLELTCQILTNQGIKLDGRRAWSTRDYGEKSEKPLSSLLVFLNDWLNFRVRDQFEIKMLIARGHSDINTTLSVIMSLFCCRSLCLCISLSRCLCLFILALSRSACRRFSL